MPKCSFCGITILKGTGKLYVRKDGRIFNFCSSKCEKNQLDLGRRARTITWTADARKAKQERSQEQVHEKEGEKE